MAKRTLVDAYIFSRKLKSALYTFTRLSITLQRVSVVTGARGCVVAMVTQVLAASVAVRTAVNHFHLDSCVIHAHKHNAQMPMA